MENSFELHRARRRLFATDAAGYGDGRPGYPAEVFDILSKRCGPLNGAHILEIGPGTGQATGPLLDAGAAVTAIELGAEMAGKLTGRHEGQSLEVIVGPFEDVTLPTTRFDLLVAATSFHWIDPEVALPRCADMLKPGAWLALWWNYFGDPNRSDPFHEALLPIFRRRAPELIDTTDSGAGAHPYALDTAARTAEIDATGLFGPVQRDVVAWTGEHTPAQTRRLFGSFSPFLALAPERREPLLDEIEQLAVDEFDGMVARPYLTPIFTAARV